MQLVVLLLWVVVPAIVFMKVRQVTGSIPISVVSAVVVVLLMVVGLERSFRYISHRWLR